MPPASGSDVQTQQAQRFLALKDLILDCNRRATDLGVMALKTSILINGAAAIALLAFIGQVFTRNATSAIAGAKLVGPLEWLVAGVAIGAFATGLRLLANVLRVRRLGRRG